jgi:hypothetical protein
VIIKEWRCLDCDAFFESAASEPECPHCSATEPERAFLTPPGFKSPSTTAKDQMVRGLAADYGLSDVNNRYGQAVKQAPSGPAAPQFKGADQINSIPIPAHERDALTPVLPSIQRMGGPRSWQRKQGS